MIKPIIKVILLISLIKSMKTLKIQDKTVSKELDHIDESRQKHEQSSQDDENLIDDDSKSRETEKNKNESSLKLVKNHKDPVENNIEEKNGRMSNKTSSEIKLKITESPYKSKNENGDSDQDEQSSNNRSGQDTDLIDNRPSLDEKTTEFDKNGLSQVTETVVENNADLIDTRPVQDQSNTDTIIVDTRPNLDEDTVHKSNDDESVGKLETEENQKKDASKTKHKKTEHINVRQDKVHLYHTMVSNHDFAYMAAVMKGSKFVCAGALIDESWILTAANGIHLMQETIRFLRIRLGSIHFKRGGILLPIKYFEIHPYFNSSKPDYDLALLMLSKPVRYTVNVRPIRLQLTPKDVTATHFIMTSWHSVARPGLNKSSVEVIKHRRILSVAHIHPSDPEDCLEELQEIGSHDGVMCLEGGAENTCVRDTGAPVVINGVLWAVISSWKPQECDDASIFATLVSGRNVSTWLHATIHGHRWHPE